MNFSTSFLTAYKVSLSQQLNDLADFSYVLFKLFL